MPRTGATGGAGLKVSGALLACIALAACAETGDLGRPRASVWNDLILPATGSIAAARRGEAVSSYPLTDAEDELRDRSWRFLMPAHERARFEAEVANLVRTRVLPAAYHPSDRRTYLAALTAAPFTSPASRFRRIGEDAEADARLIGPFARVALAVMEADRLRLKSLPFVDLLTEAEIADAAARVAENRCLVAWVKAELAERTDAYTYALEHAFIAMPQGEAVAAERAIKALVQHRLALDALPLPAWRNGACVIPAIERKVKERVVAKG